MPPSKILRPRRAAPLALATALTLAAVSPPAAAAEPAPVRVRVVAANISSGPLQSYPLPGPGARILAALDPDVVLIQELNVNATRNQPNDDAALRAWVDAVLGVDFHVFREPGGDQIPNGVISRWPIVEAGEWDDLEVGNRDFAFARIDLPGEIDLWVVSVHLLTRGPGTRRDEAAALVARIRERVPDGDYLVVGGDFNTDRRNEPALAVLAEVVDTFGPFPDDGGDPPDGDTNAGRRRPYDWVLVDGDLQQHAAPVEIGGLVFPAGLVFDSRIFDQDDLDQSFPGVLTGDSGAPQMQHMAVVRDFLVPAGAPPPASGVIASAAEIDFGAVDAAAGALDSDAISLRAAAPARLLTVAFDGSHPGEFALVEPSLEDGPVTIEGETRLVFRWTPAAGDDAAARAPRDVTATLVVDADPGALEIRLAGRIARPSPVDAVDLAAFRLEQTGGDAALTLPPGTLLAPGGLLVVGRAASREAFEAFWGPLPEETVYLSGEALAGEPGFPILNGGERFRLVDASGAPVDPPAGTIPATGTSRRRVYQRPATAEATLEERDELAASPGRYDGDRAGTGRVVITEVADAVDYEMEFVELLFDAAGEPDPAPTPPPGG